MTEYVRAPRANRFVNPKVAKVTEPRIKASMPTIEIPSLAEIAQLYRLDPREFIRKTFRWGEGEGLDPWQEEVLETIGEELRNGEPIHRFAIASGKGAGKTTLAALLFLWHVACHEGKSQTVATSVTGFQTASRLWREIRKWRNRWILRPYFTIHSTRLEYVGEDTWFGQHQTWSLDRPEAFQGTHEEYTGFFVDEASGIPDVILETIESGATDKHVIIVYISNATRATGRFRECFRRYAEWWTTWNIDTRQVERVSRASIAKALAEANEDEEAASFRRDVRGEFPLANYDAVIPEWILERACERTEGERGREIVIGCDIARFGSNKTVFVVRQGCRILEVLVYQKQELEDTAAKLMDVIRKYQQYLFRGFGNGVPLDRDLLQSAEQMGYKLKVFVDGDGVGIGVARMCVQAGFQVTEVHSAERAYQDEKFANRRAEMWFKARDWLRDVACLDKEAPYYQILLEQLTDIYYKHDMSNRMLIESKDELLARGVQSPDMADALIYSLFDMHRPRIHEMAVLL